MTDATPSAASVPTDRDPRTIPEVLTPEDVEAVRATTKDISDLPGDMREHIQERFRLAFERADGVVAGSIEPLSV